MKRVFYLGLITSLFSLSSCFPVSVKNVSEGVKVVGQCCSSISTAAASVNCSALLSKEKSFESEREQEVEVFPNLTVMIWDTKMMIW